MTVSISNMSQVWMSNTNTYNAIAMSVSTMGYGANANSKLLLLRVDGNTKFEVDTTGLVRANNIVANTITVNTIITLSGVGYLPNTSGASFNGDLNLPSGSLRIANYGAIGPQSNNTGIVIHGGNNLSGNPTQSGIIFRGNTGGLGGTASNGLELYAGGSECVRVDASGNIGIGTASPAYKLDVNGLIKDSKGDVRDIPLNTQSSPYALTLSDTGKFISTNTSVFVPNGIFSSGHTISIFNSSSATINIIANSDVTFRLAGQSNDNNRLLAQNGIATIVCVSANNFVLSGAGLL